MQFSPGAAYLHCIIIDENALRRQQLSRDFERGQGLPTPLPLLQLKTSSKVVFCSLHSSLTLRPSSVLRPTFAFAA